MQHAHLLATLLACLPLLAVIRPSRLAAPAVQLVLGLLALTALIGLAVPSHTWHAVSIASAGNPHAFSLGVTVDRLSMTMAAFIAAIGLIVVRYASRYLQGEASRPRFIGYLGLTLTAALVQVVSPGLVQFALAWTVVSIGLTRLLMYYPQRPGAVLAARNKTLVSRLGDTAMLGAIVAAGLGLGTTDLGEMGAVLAAGSATSATSALTMVTVFLSIAVLCKTALLPFQHWLVGTIEAPTPLSALMHAGVVNAGGYLVIRFSNLYAAAPAGLELLLVFGLVSAALAPLVMWAQTDLKRSLAWSTVGQMGFMAVQCGIGAFGAAFLHLIGHGFYKANAFLRSGTLLGMVEPEVAPRPFILSVVAWVIGLALGGVVLVATYGALGFPPERLHGGWTLIAVQALAVAQMLATPTPGRLATVVRGGLVVVSSAVYAALTVAAEWWLAPVTALVAAPAHRGAIGLILAIGVPAILAVLSLVWIALPSASSRPLLRAWRVHAGNGLYLAQISEKVVLWCWPRGRGQEPRR